MTLQLSTGSPYKAFVKKLDNGFGIKTINTLTGVENVVVITADSIKESYSDKKIVIPQSQILRPLLSKFSKGTVSATLSVPSINQPDNAINKVLEHLEPYLRETKAAIAGFHVFDEGDKRDKKSSSNKQKASVIFVANTELARKKSVHFDIPGKLMNVFVVDGQNKEGKIQFEAKSVIKPLTIVVSDYVLHINICYDLPQSKTVGTQTKKRYILSSVVDDVDDKPIFKIESFLPSDLLVEPEQKFTQTESISFIEEPQSPQRSLCQGSRTQTIFFTDQISSKLMTSSDKNCCFLGDKSGLNTDMQPVGNIQTESLEYRSEKSTDFENPLKSCMSYNSHAHLYQTAVLNDMPSRKGLTRTNIENEEVEQEAAAYSEQEKKTFTLFDNSSNYNTKITSSGNAFKNIEKKCSSNSTACPSSKSTSFEKDRSDMSVKTVNSDNELTQKRNSENSSNVSIKDIKERLNKTKLYLQQLYSVIDMLEEKNENRSRSETAFQTTGYVEKEQPNNKTHMSRQTSIRTSQATLEESTSINYSDQSAYLSETRLGSYESSRTTSYEKSLRNYTDTSSSDILCELCGSFHTYVGFDTDCKMFEKNNIQILENSSSQGTMNSGSLTDHGNLSKSVSSVSAIANTPLDKMDSCGSSESFSNKMQSSLDTNNKDSIMLFKEDKETTLHDNEEDDLDSGTLSMKTDSQKTIVLPEQSNQMLVDHNYKQSQEIMNQNRSDIWKLSEETFVSRKEYEISTFDHELTDFNEPFKVENPSSLTLRENKEPSNETISSNGNYSSEECLESTAESNNSTQNITRLHNTLDEINNPSSSTTLSNKNIKMGDTKDIDECNTAHNLTGSQTTMLRNENKTDVKKNSKLLFFTELRATKSWTSFKKCVKSCEFDEKFGLHGRNTHSEPTANQLKIKTLSSGDHLHKHVLCKVSSSLEERLNTIGLFNNKLNFQRSKHSSLSTLHITPSSQELIKLKSQENNFQDREQTLGKIESKTPSLTKWFVKSRGICNKRQDGSLLSTTQYSRRMTFENKLVANKINLKSSKKSKTVKMFTQNKHPKTHKQKKSKLFCFFI